MLDNKVLNEYLAANQSKVRCPFCDQIFDVNVILQTTKKVEDKAEDKVELEVEEEDDEDNEKTKAISKIIVIKSVTPITAQPLSSSPSSSALAAGKKAVKCPNVSRIFWDS